MRGCGALFWQPPPLLLLLLFAAAASGRLQWDCGPLAGGACTEMSVRCAAGSALDCVECCNAAGRAGCCSWRGNETAAGQNESAPAPPDLCWFHPDGVLSGGAPTGLAQVCTSSTETATATPTLSTTPTLTVPFAHATCSGGSDFFPKIAPVGVNWTLTVYCRRGLAGESVFLTRKKGSCDPEAALLLGDYPTGDVAAVVRASGADSEGHPLFTVPPLYEAGTYQLCLKTLQEHMHAFSSPLRVQGTSVRPYVWFDPGSRELIADGFALSRDTVQFTVSRTADCTSPVYPLGSVPYRVTGDGRFAVMGGVALDPGRYYSCFRPFPDDPWSAHAAVAVPERRLRRASTAPARVAVGQPFLLTLFGDYVANESAAYCRVVPVDGHDPEDCHRQGVSAATVSVVAEYAAEDARGFAEPTIQRTTVTCDFPHGTGDAGWHYACLGDLNSSSRYDERGYHKASAGGATFEVKPRAALPVASVVPVQPLSKAWLNVLLTGGNIAVPEGSHIKLQETPCDAEPDELNKTTEFNAYSNEARVYKWRGPKALVPFSEPCPFHTGHVSLRTVADSVDKTYRICYTSSLPSAASPAYGFCGENATFTSTRVERVGVRVRPRDGPADCSALGGVYNHASHRCELWLCRGSLNPETCPGPLCSLLEVTAVMGIGECLADPLATVGLPSQADACEAFRGKYERGHCWFHVCRADSLSSAGDPGSGYERIKMSEPMMIKQRTFPVYVCLRRMYTDEWLSVGGFGVDDSCELKKAKYCRYVSCGDHLANPGPCTLLGMDGAGGHSTVEKTGLGNYQPTGRAYEPSALSGIAWNAVLQGPSNLLQQVCHDMACHADRYVLVRFEKSVAHRHPSWAVSPDGLEARYVGRHVQYQVPGAEIHALTTELPLSMDPVTEVTVGFNVVHGDGHILKLGLVANHSALPFENSTATPLRFVAAFAANESRAGVEAPPCSLRRGAWYRAVFRSEPSEITVWPDGDGAEIARSPACYLHRPTSFDFFAPSTGWRLAFVITVPSGWADRPKENEARVALRP
ncbi:hypothetical protein DIPPA_14143 [Diplonema papillatum]|nr:hypothetical protein DIPPA_14143 [Diplonema papillatum]|eukprot:gene19571-30144_t